MPDRFRAYDASGNVVAAADVNEDGQAEFAADNVAKVVFYAGEPDEEAVAGSVDVVGSGSFVVDLP